jgi:hypothetical protein
MRSWNHVILINGRAYTSRDAVTAGDELARVDPEVEHAQLKPGDFVIVRRTLMARVRRTLADGSVVCVVAKASAGRKARAIQL